MEVDYVARKGSWRTPLLDDLKTINLQGIAAAVTEICTRQHLYKLKEEKYTGKYSML
uniref:Uncharacterized protein n=1 Tax=Arundo donax TaxID=35708 RepID=A0A0A8ZWG6_ARUDO